MYELFCINLPVVNNPKETFIKVIDPLLTFNTTGELNPSIDADEDKVILLLLAYPPKSFTITLVPTGIEVDKVIVKAALAEFTSIKADSALVGW
jgi:hypothetical protein